MATLDFDQTIEESHLALAEFVLGNAEPFIGMYSHGDDVIIANPFGPPARGWKQAAETMKRAASNYRDGKVVAFESFAKYVTPDLAYIVELEQYQVKIGGSDDPVQVALRVTSIFRPEDGVWKIVHRHADPITTSRPAESVIQ